jgi:outer membrane protein insertion porin family
VTSPYKGLLPLVGFWLALVGLPARAQDDLSTPEAKSKWYGKTIQAVELEGFSTPDTYRSRFPPGGTLNAEKAEAIRKKLAGTEFEHLSQFTLKARAVPDDPEAVVLIIEVREFQRITEVQFRGLTEFDPDDLKSSLRATRGAFLNPYELKRDQEYLTDSYKEKGYYFAEVFPDPQEVGPGRVQLTWQVVEGPEVEVDEIRFTGNPTLDTDDLLDIMGTKESGLLSSGPFVERKLLLDLERIKLYYWLEGWQDIYSGDRVFIEGLDFSPDRSEVVIRIHIKEPARYHVKSIRVEGNTIFPTEKVMSWIKLQPGEPASERKIGEDLKTIEARYAEQAYIMARINHEWVQETPEEAGKLALRIVIEEGKKIVTGRVDIVNNSKTKDEVLRREFRDFGPGEYYNQDTLERGINRLYDMQYFTRGAIKFHDEPHKDERGVEADDIRDVKIEVEEGKTGDLRLLGGFSSAFGFLGSVVVTQRNFDIADTPDSIGEIFDGDAFVGAGQVFRLRLTPAQRRQSYSIEFREPYLFGEPVGMTVRGYDVTTLRRSWDEERRGGELIFDKRWDDLVVELGLSAYEVDISDVKSSAPSLVRRIEGLSSVVSITPGIRYDTRDSAMMPTEGLLASTSFELAGAILPGGYDFYKWNAAAEYFHTIYEAEERKRQSRYVVSGRLNLGYGQPYGESDELPIFERYFAGGTSSMRGYKYRGMGPHEGDDPIGGKVLILAGVEYSMPFLVDMLRVAAFYDVGTLANTVSELGSDEGRFRHVAGFGFRVMIPFLGNAPLALDFGFPLNEVDGDEEQMITFDVGKFF